MRNLSFVSSFILAVLVCAFGVRYKAEAASFSKADLYLEGLSRPMADILEFDVYLAHGEAEATVEVRGFTVTGESFDKLIPIKASAAGKYRDAEGNYFNTARCVRQDRSGVPLSGEKPVLLHNGFFLFYRDMDLPLGVHKIAFELRSFVKGQQTALIRTPLTQVTITQEPRTKSRLVMLRTLKDGEEPQINETVSEEPDPILPGKNRRVGTQVLEFPLETPLTGGWYRKKIDAWETGNVRVLENIADVRNGPYTEADLEPLLPGADEIAPAPELLENLSPTGHIRYATNRNLIAGKQFVTDTSRFGNEPTTLRTGSAFFHIPTKDHKMGTLELPKGNKGGFAISELFEIPEKDFYQREIHDRIGYGSRDVLLYVHGFNNTMDFAALRYMQFVHDIRFRGLPLAYFWPSEGSGSVGAYKRDEVRAAQSAAPLADFLVNLVEQHTKAKVPGKIHLLAHSMGNRVLLNAVHLAKDRIEKITGQNSKPFGSVVLAAADVDLVDFNIVIPATVELSDTVYNYHCEDDVALTVSRGLHVAKRLGEQAVHEKGVIDVDTKNANTSLIGHDYYVSNTPLLYDLTMVFTLGTPIAERITVRGRRNEKGLVEFYFP